MNDYYSEEDTQLKDRLVQVPMEHILKETLMALIEEYVTRDGTDYGPIEHSLTNKREQVVAKLTSGELIVCFDPVAEDIDIVSKEYLANP